MFAVHRDQPGAVPAGPRCRTRTGATIGYHLVVPGIPGGASSAAVLLIIAIVGTTVAPWQLFFQQSNVIDKRITPRFIGYERADTVLGAVVVVVGAVAIIVVAVVTRSAAPTWSGTSPTPLGVARRARASTRYWYGALFAIVLLDASIIGAVGGDPVHQLRVRRRVRPEALAAPRASGTPSSSTPATPRMVVVAAAIVLIPGAPLGLITTSVQALAGVLLPSASVFLLLLCNDPEVLGPWVNRRWLNVLAGVIIGVLLTLSGTLVVTTVFPQLNVGRRGGRGGPRADRGRGRGDAVAGLIHRGSRRTRPVPPRMSEQERRNWRMPPLALLRPVQWSPGTKLGMLLLRGYLVVSVILLAVKAVQLGGG